MPDVCQGGRHVHLNSILKGPLFHLNVLISGECVNSDGSFRCEVRLLK